MQAELITSGKLLGEFRQWCKGHVARGNPAAITLRNYQADIAQHLAWLDEEGVPFLAVDAEDLAAYRTWLVAEYAASTVARKIASLRTYYDMLTARDLLDRNPAHDLEAPEDKRDRAAKIKYLSEREITRLFELPNPHTPKGVRDLAMLACMYLGGLRTMEVAGLDVGDVDLDNTRLTVVGKGRKTRVVPMNEELHSILKLWLKYRMLMGVEVPAVFVNMHHNREGLPKRMSKRAVRLTVDTYLDRAGLKRPGVSCHSLRHSFATHALDYEEMRYIKQMLGHASIQTTEIYAQVRDLERNNPAKHLGGPVRAALEKNNGSSDNVHYRKGNAAQI
jgi:site-specific recombinase XerD